MRISLDGQRISTEYHDNGPLAKVSPRFGLFQIGSWEVPDNQLPPELLRREDGSVIRVEDSPAVAEWRSLNQRTLKGRIDEVMIFRRALADAEIADLYRASRP